MTKTLSCDYDMTMLYDIISSKWTKTSAKSSLHRTLIWTDLMLVAWLFGWWSKLNLYPFFYVKIFILRKDTHQSFQQKCVHHHPEWMHITLPKSEYNQTKPRKWISWAHLILKVNLLHKNNTRQKYIQSLYLYTKNIYIAFMVLCACMIFVDLCTAVVQNILIWEEREINF